MKDGDKTKEQLINELVEMRQRVARLEASETERKRAEEEQERLLVAEHEQRLLAETLAEVTLALTSQTSHSAVLDEILHQAQRIVPCSTANITLLEGDTLRVVRWQGYEAFGAEEMISGLVQSLDDLTSDAEVVHSRKPMVIPDTHQDPRWVVFDETAWIRSYLVIPICLRDRVLGLLRLDSETPGKFSAEDAERLQPLADAAAIALENTRLFTATRHQAEQLEMLREVGLELTAQLDLDTLLHSIVSRAMKLMGGDSGGLYLYRPEKDVLEWSMAVGPNLAPIGTTLRRGEGLSGRVWETGEPLIVDDYQAWEEGAAIYEGYSFGAVVGVPVRWGEEFLGVVNVLAEPPHTFSPADAKLLSLFATQAAIAIRNARLYEDTRRRGLEQETVSRIAYALNTPDVRDAFPVLVEGLQDLTGCDVVSLVAMDEAGEQFIMTVLESPFPPPVPPNLGGQGGVEGDVMPLSATAAAEDMEAGRPHLTADLSTETHFPLEQALYQAGLRSQVTLPLLVGGEVFGALNLGGSQTGLFREDQLPVLQQIADAVALALENSLLFQTEREQRDRAEALEEATAALTATLDSNQVLDRILEQVSRVVPNDATNIMLIEGNQMRIVRWRGYERFGAEEFVSTVVFHIPEVPNLQQMMESREPIVIPDTATYPGWVRIPVQAWLRSYAAAPIVVRGEVIGFLNVDSATPGFFTQAHAETLRAFADHA
ncbi:MAG: GAF domain-containing protein, partial [Anaerolineales bacterium]|nr:GAF domain-containing protein [Anaerolineales bacterium]